MKRLTVVYTLGMLHFGEKLFTATCRANHAHLLGVGNRVEKSFMWQARNLDFKYSQH